jgi:hypothetical protein
MNSFSGVLGNSIYESNVYYAAGEMRSCRPQQESSLMCGQEGIGTVRKGSGGGEEIEASWLAERNAIPELAMRLHAIVSR